MLNNNQLSSNHLMVSEYLDILKHFNTKYYTTILLLKYFYLLSYGYTYKPSQVTLSDSLIQKYLLISCKTPY